MMKLIISDETSKECNWWQLLTPQWLLSATLLAML